VPRGSTGSPILAARIKANDPDRVAQREAAPVQSPVTVLPVASQDARRLGVLRDVLGDLSRAQAALVSRAND
jgi:hypothetical protein